MVASRAAYQEARSPPTRLATSGPSSATPRRPAGSGRRTAARSTRWPRPTRCWATRPARWPPCIASRPSATPPNVAADSDFARLRSVPAFVAVRRELERNATPIAPGRPAFTLPERDLLTEGIAYDPVTRMFFVGSVHHGKILRVDPRGGGRVTEFVAARGGRASGLRSACAWTRRGGCSGSRRRRSRRRAATRPRTVSGAASSVSTWRRASPPAASSSPTTGSLTPWATSPSARTGDVYATDSRAPSIYRVRAGADRLERFVESPLLLSAQGLALDPDERTLYVADYARGILRVDLATGEVVPVPAPDDVLALGIDGLYRVGRALIGIQNGVRPHRVVRLRSLRTASGSTRSRSSSAPGRTTPSRLSEWWWAASCSTSPTASGSSSATMAASRRPLQLQRPLVLRLRL